MTRSLGNTHPKQVSLEKVDARDDASCIIGGNNLHDKRTTHFLEPLEGENEPKTRTLIAEMEVYNDNNAT